MDLEQKINLDAQQPAILIDQSEWSNLKCDNLTIRSFSLADNVTHSPVAIYWQSLEEPNAWKLSFQTKPKPDIILTGRLPTLQEVVEACSIAGFPASAALMLMVCAQVAFEKQSNKL